MITDNLKDILKHTHSLGLFETAKVTGDDDNTTVESMSKERTVVMYGKLKNNLEGLNGIVGFSRMAVLNGYLTFDPFLQTASKTEIVNQNKGGRQVPAEIKMESGQGHTAAYRFMSEEAVQEQIKVPKFKGAGWGVSFTPTKQNIKELVYFSSILGTFEPTFTVKLENENVNFFIGSGPTDRTVIPFAKGVKGELKSAWSYPLVEVLSILKLAETSTCVMNFSDNGALKIDIDSGLGYYEYIVPAKTK